MNKLMQNKIVLPTVDKPQLRLYSFYLHEEMICANQYYVNETLAKFNIPEQVKDNWLAECDNCVASSEDGLCYEIKADLELEKATFQAVWESEVFNDYIFRFDFFLSSNRNNRLEIEFYDQADKIGSFAFFFSKEKNKWLTTRRFEESIFLKISISNTKIEYFLSYDGVSWDFILANELSKKVEGKLKGVFRLSAFENEWINYLYANFIQIDSCIESASMRTQYQFNLMKGWESYFVHSLLNYNTGNIGIVKKYNGGILQYIKYHIAAEHYIELNLDEYFLKDRIRYHKKHLSHPNLLYGYDDEKQSFLLLGIDEDGYPCKTEVSYINFLEALDEKYNETHEMIIMEHRFLEKEYKFNVDAVIQQFENFLNNISILKQVYSVVSSKNRDCAGIQVYDVFYQNVDIFLLDIHLSYIVVERFKIMVNRIVFLKERKYIEDEKAEEIKKGYESLVELSSRMLKEVLFYNMSKRATCRESIKKELLDCKEKDLVLTKELLTEMRKYKMGKSKNT